MYMISMGEIFLCILILELLRVQNSSHSTLHERVMQVKMSVYTILNAPINSEIV